MVEVYNHTGVLAPEDRLEDCQPWLHELGWRPPGWVFGKPSEQPLSWPARTGYTAAAAPPAARDGEWVDLPY